MAKLVLTENDLAVIANALAGTEGCEALADKIAAAQEFEVRGLMTAAGLAVPTDGVLILDAQVSPEGVVCLKVHCGDYDVFKKLPKAVTHGGRTFGLTGWDSDTCLACYRSDAQIARPA